MKDVDDYNSYEDKIDDVDEVTGTDVKINPDYYIHKALLNAQTALADPDIKVGMIRFRIMVEHVQDLASAAGMLDPDYRDYIKGLKDEILKEAPDLRSNDLALNARIASRKLERIMKQVFANKVIAMPLRA